MVVARSGKLSFDGEVPIDAVCGAGTVCAGVGFGDAVACCGYVALAGNVKAGGGAVATELLATTTGVGAATLNATA